MSLIARGALESRPPGRQVWCAVWSAGRCCLDPVGVSPWRAWQHPVGNLAPRLIGTDSTRWAVSGTLSARYFSTVSRFIQLTPISRAFATG